jgi:hypothetical protein
MLQSGDDRRVDLPEDEESIVKLLINYLYEGDYEPKLPDGKVAGEPDEVATATGPKVDEYHYTFPHTCRPKCPSPEYQVCQHHSCTMDTCGEKCFKFVCKECCPGYFGIRPAPEGNTTQLLLHSKMYEMGEKYDVTGLKGLAREKFMRSCIEHWDSEHFAPAAHHACSTTVEEDIGLREVVITVISEHMSLMNKPEVVALLHEFNGLAVGVLQKRAKKSGWITDDSGKNKG